MVNILFITVRADLGGGPKHIDSLIENIGSDFLIFVACPDNDPYFKKWSIDKRINKIIKIPYRKMSLFYLMKILIVCHRYKINIVHSHSRGAGYYSRMLKLLMPNLKIVHTFHGIFIDDYSKIQKIIYKHIEKAMSYLTDKFICVSNGEKNIYDQYQLGKCDKSVVIYNGINQIEYVQGMKSKLNLPMDKIIVLTIARFTPQKNYELCLQIAANSEMANLFFIWIGDGEEWASLRKNKSTNVIMPGASTNVNEYLSASDIYLSTSRREGLPISLIEAASIGLPIIASDVTGNNEIVENEYNGFLFNLNSSSQAVKLLSTLAKNAKMRSIMGINSRQKYNDNFKTATMINSINNVYSTLMKRKEN